MAEVKADEKGITVKKSDNFSEWYVQALTKSGFIDYGDVSGTIIFRPSAYFVWETVSRATDAEFKKVGIENTYFPLFIPEHYLQKEAEHFEGFVPEVAWVTEVGHSKLDERLAIRPTSETIMYPSYAKWIRSWRDLPLRYNQWNNVVRWEFKHATPFIRTREFLWNEGHSVFATNEEAEAEREQILGIESMILKEYLALPGIVGRKTDKEKFAGAVASYSIESVLPDGWALQGPDFHNDGQNFAKAFNIKFLDKEGKESYAYQNTYAISTRVLGSMIALHGDDKGLVLPPKVAYKQIALIPIFRKDNADVVLEYAKKIESELKLQFRVFLDDREGYSPGFKFSDAELKGIPLRMEIGAKEIERNEVVLVRRDNGAKSSVALSSLAAETKKILDAMQTEMYQKAEALMKSFMQKPKDFSEFKKLLEEKSGIMHAPWCGELACEDAIKNETRAKATNMPLDQSDLNGNCIYCGKPAKHMVNFARSY